LQSEFNLLLSSSQNSQTLLQNQVQSLGEKLQALQQESSTKINEQKALIQTKERELDDVANAYDRDRALHEQRIGFADT